ncbi:pentatricopeptide repeat-containing protein [Skeletonema marinoi]|uniref:Pentatricopeptide repeat-containing protein n=1 Tax=Skeletonema marinoi TaxID=267567 RepID=A0AAD8YPP3_9STRA|nr:pentatricopeptide repeat-containing protein [Skeletonema marinoi]
MKGRSLLCQCIRRSSTALSRQAATRPSAQWNFQHQQSSHFRHHYFASVTEPIQTGTINNQKEESHAPNLDFTSEAPTSANEERSLHSTIHYVLTRDVGRLSIVNIQKARSFLSITSKWNNEKGAVLCEQLLERLFEERYTGSNINVVIESDMYNICMNAWNKSNADGQKIVHQVESILHRMEQRYFDHQDTPPDNISYNCLINAYSKSDEDSADKVESILEKMNSFAHDNNVFSSEAASRISPDETTYNSMMNYYASRKNDHISAQRAEDLLLQLSGLSQHDSAWSNSGGGIHGAKRAEELLRMMLKLRKEHANVQPTSLTFSTAINAYSKVAPEDSATAVRRAIELLDELEGLYIPDSENINTCYNAAANVIAKSGVPNSSELILDLMNRMKNMDAVPDGMIGDVDGIKRGKQMLEQMIDEPHFEPTSANFNILLNAILKSKSERKLEEAEELVAQMQEIGGDARPDSASFNMIISALSRSNTPDAAEKAVDYLRSMLRLYNNDGYGKAKPDSFAFNCVINMLARSKHEWAYDVIQRTLSAMEAQERHGNASVLLDTITYNVVIGKLAQSASITNAKKVMKLLATMEAKAESGSTAVVPDIITYTNVLKLQGKVNPQRAASIASSYLTLAMSSDDKIFIDRVGFYTLLHALSRSNKFEDAATARNAWEWIEKSDRADVVLTSDACNLVTIAYSKNKTEEAAAEVLSFLSDLIHRYRQGDKDTVLPTKVGFSAAFIPLCATNRTNDALSLLKIIKALNIVPDAGCYISMLSALSGRSLQMQMKEDLEDVPTAAFNAAINACAWVSGSPVGQRKALEIAFEIFQQARKEKSYDSVTFGLIIKACMHLSKDDNARMKLIQPLFELCAKNGLVGSMVEREMRHLVSRLIPGKLPQEWTKNAKDKK